MQVAANGKKCTASRRVGSTPTFPVMDLDLPDSGIWGTSCAFIMPSATLFSGRFKLHAVVLWREKWIDDMSVSFFFGHWC